MIDFQIAKDRRDGLLHATNISLCEESFIVSKEKRDKGNSRTVIFNVKEMVFCSTRWNWCVFTICNYLVATLAVCDVFCKGLELYWTPIDYFKAVQRPNHCTRYTLPHHFIS